jgi:hypothetical protein
MLLIPSSWPLLLTQILPILTQSLICFPLFPCCYTYHSSVFLWHAPLCSSTHVTSEMLILYTSTVSSMQCSQTSQKSCKILDAHPTLLDGRFSPTSTLSDLRCSPTLPLDAITHPVFGCNLRQTSQKSCQISVCITQMQWKLKTINPCHLKTAISRTMSDLSYVGCQNWAICKTTGSWLCN